MSPCVRRGLRRTPFIDDVIDDTETEEEAAPIEDGGERSEAAAPNKDVMVRVLVVGDDGGDGEPGQWKLVVEGRRRRGCGTLSGSPVPAGNGDEDDVDDATDKEEEEDPEARIAVLTLLTVEDAATTVSSWWFFGDGVTVGES